MSTVARTPAAPFGRAVALHSIGWLVAANVVGVWLAVCLVWPTVGNLIAPLTYGRWTPLHLDWQLYGWCSLPIVGALLMWCVDPRHSRAGIHASLALSAWSTALALGGIGWLGGSVSGKLFLDWHGWTRPLLPLAMYALWAILAAHTWWRWTDLSLVGRASRMVVLGLLFVVPSVLFWSTSRGMYQSVNPDSGGATGPAVLGSTLGIITIFMLTPTFLRVVPTRSIAPFVGALFASWLVFATVKRGNVSHHAVAQIVALALLLIWIPLLPMFWRRHDWPAATRPWLKAATVWWAILVLTGWISFLPGVSESLKFTHALVGHAHLAMGALITSVNAVVVVVLSGRAAPRSVFWLWQGGCAIYITSMYVLGGAEVYRLAEFIRGEAWTQALLEVRLASGVAMTAGSVRWLATVFRTWTGSRASGQCVALQPDPVARARIGLVHSSKCGCACKESGAMVDHPSRRSIRVSWLAALGVITATYFYFLIFAEFAFLDLARRVAPSGNGLRGLMLALGAGGVIGAISAAGPCRKIQASALLTWTLRGCALSALLAVVVNTPLTLWIAGLAVGLSLGTLTVTLAASLRAATTGSRLGLCIGSGTGVAYALSNIPWIFHAAPETQTILAAMLVGAASFLPRLLLSTANSAPSLVPSAFEVARWTGVMLALVWMDSAAFYIVQHEETLRTATWHTRMSLLGNAAIHLFVAMAAGALLDRGARRSVVAMAVVALGAACLMLNGTLPANLPAAWIYTAGVSLYSTVLVEFPARTAQRWVATTIFGIAGWFGSAAGIGMAQDLANIPTGWVVAAVALVIVALSWQRRYAVALIAVVAAANPSDLQADDISLGREVYIAEGCMHCHSQFIRPRSDSDALLWGPVMPLQDALSAAPPLFGTRRQGPDLSHVGNRRSPEWNRLHLLAPQEVSPGSRMPSYQYLFSGDKAPGEALVAYLASLGAETLNERHQQITAWQPKADGAVAPKKAKQLFSRMCAQCHGPEGRGDGPLAQKLTVRPPDWSQSPWRHVTPDASMESNLCRIIKFGLPGLPMAGHEYLPDAEILGLARFVQRLHKSDPSSPVTALP